MPVPIMSEEFIGRFIVSYKDDEIIYAFDEITHGLYKFSFDLKEISMILTPESIQCSSEKIVGISKREDELILIPYYINSKWIFFDRKNEKIRYDSLFEDSICISTAVTIGIYLFLIPANTLNPIIIISLDEMKIINIYEKWYEQTGNKIDIEPPIWSWGSSLYDDIIVFPLINSNHIGYINKEDVKIITLDIPNPINSVSVFKNKIWILPVAGEYIYISDLRGNIIDRIKLHRTEFEILANDFLRIVSTGENIFLFPIYKGSIYVYKSKEDRIIQLKEKENYLRGRLFEYNLTPYWEYVIEGEFLHLLPCDYRYKTINITSLEINEYSFSYGKDIDHNKYWKIIGGIRGECILERKENDLEDFLQYIYYFHENCSEKNDKKISGKIWKTLK